MPRCNISLTSLTISAAWHFLLTSCVPETEHDSVQVLQPVPVFQWNSGAGAKRLEISRNASDSELSHRQKRSRESHILRFNQKRPFSSWFDNLSPSKQTEFKMHSAHDGRNSVQNADNPFSLDLLIVTDFSVYKHFLEDVAGNEQRAVDAIFQYYTGILQELSKMYSTQRLGFMRFRVYPTGIIIAKTLNDSPWIFSPWPDESESNSSGQNRLESSVKKFQESNQSIDVYQTLRNFRFWIKQNSENLPEHDHAIAITRLDLERFGDTNAQGIAFVGRICRLGESISLVEDVGFMATVAIAGHELAHSLGAEHDGQNNANGCSTVHNYLMVPAVATAVDTLPNTFTFSECTIEQIKRHITSPYKNTECLRYSSLQELGYPGLNNPSGSTLLPGQVFNANEQCRHSFGLEYQFCAFNDYYLKQMCRQIWCRNMTAGWNSQCYSKPYLPALTGTSCGNKMWCINGACVEDVKAPLQEGCLFGDRDTSFCTKLVASEPSACKQKAYGRFCCESCRQFKRNLYRRLRLR